MPAVVIKGVPPWDGRYELPDAFNFNNRELDQIKRMCGTRAGEILDELERGDAGTVVAIATVVLAKEGKVVDPDDLWNAEGGSVMLDFATPEADADPPTPPSKPSETSEK